MQTIAVKDDVGEGPRWRSTPAVDAQWLTPQYTAKNSTRKPRADIVLFVVLGIRATSF